MKINDILDGVEERINKEFAGYILWSDFDKDHYFLQCPISEKMKSFISSEIQSAIREYEKEVKNWLNNPPPTFREEIDKEGHNPINLDKLAGYEHAKWEIKELIKKFWGEECPCGLTPVGGHQPHCKYFPK